MEGVFPFINPLATPVCAYLGERMPPAALQRLLISLTRPAPATLRLLAAAPQPKAVPAPEPVEDEAEQQRRAEEHAAAVKRAAEEHEAALAAYDAVREEMRVAIAAATVGRKGEPLLVRKHAEFPELLTVPCTGPYGHEPAEKELVISLAGGERALCGGDVLGQDIKVLPLGVYPSDTVAVMVDLQDTSTKGSNKPFSGNKLFVGNGIVHLNRQDVFDSDGSNDSAVAVELVERVFNVLPRSYPDLPAGVCWHPLREVLACRALAPPEGAHVLDLCAGTGESALLLATMVGPSGRITALCPSSDAATAAWERAKTAEVSNIDFFYGPPELAAAMLERDNEPPAFRTIKTQTDQPVLVALDPSAALAALAGASKGGGGGGNETAGAGADEGAGADGAAPAADSAAALARSMEAPRPLADGFALGSFDAIMVDPPCSQTAVRPQLNNAVSLEDIARHRAKQKWLMRSAAALLRPGGILVYTTASFAPAENDDVVALALDQCSLELVELPADSAGSSSSSSSSSSGGGGGSLTAEQASKVQRLDAVGPSGWAGGFLAKLTKTAGEHETSHDFGMEMITPGPVQDLLASPEGSVAILVDAHSETINCLSWSGKDGEPNPLKDNLARFFGTQLAMLLRTVVPGTAKFTLLVGKSGQIATMSSPLVAACGDGAHCGEALALLDALEPDLDGTAPVDQAGMFTKALTSKAEAILYLCASRMDAATAGRIRDVQTKLDRKVPVHVVHFLRSTDKGVAELEQLAKDTGGSFKSFFKRV